MLHCDEVVIVVPGPGVLEIVIVLVDLDAAAVHDWRGPHVRDGSQGGRGVQGVVAGVKIFDPVIWRRWRGGQGWRGWGRGRRWWWYFLLPPPEFWSPKFDFRYPEGQGQVVEMYPYLSVGLVSLIHVCSGCQPVRNWVDLLAAAAGLVLTGPQLTSDRWGHNYKMGLMVLWARSDTCHAPADHPWHHTLHWLVQKMRYRVIIG